MKLDGIWFDDAAVDEYAADFNAWHDRNFGSTTTELTVMAGTLEEVGEVCRCIVKMEQGIRGTRDEWLDELAKELGDVVVKVFDCIKWYKADPVEVFWYAEGLMTRLERGPVMLHLAELGRAISDVHRSKGLASHLGGMIAEAALVAKPFGLDLGDCFRQRWAKVRQRDWVADPQSGGQAA